MLEQSDIPLFLCKRLCPDVGFNFWSSFSLEKHTSLFILRKPLTFVSYCDIYGYIVLQCIALKMTDGAIRLTPGTMYGSLSKMEKDNIIRFIREEDTRKIYQITDLGLEVLQLERKRNVLF